MYTFGRGDMWRRRDKKNKSGPVPRPTIDHPQLGVLERDDQGCWIGVRSRPGGGEVDISLEGDASGPDAAQADRLARLVGDLAGFERVARAFIATQDLSPFDAPPDRFHLESIWFLYPPSAGDSFMVYLSLEDDSWGHWRIDFENGVPAYLARDD